MNRDLLHFNRRKEELKGMKDVNIISSGKVNGQLVLAVMNANNKYKNIHVQTDFYEEEFGYEEFVCNWTDVEGMDYGWAWCRFTDEDDEIDYAELKSYLYNSYVAKELKKIISKNDYAPTYYIHYLQDEGEHFDLFNLNNIETVKRWVFSDKDLYYL